MKQHVRETKGQNGHDKVYCLKCDSVFFKTVDRDTHDLADNCILALLEKPKPFLSVRQKQIVQDFNKESMQKIIPKTKSEEAVNNKQVIDSQKFPQQQV